MYVLCFLNIEYLDNKKDIILVNPRYLNGGDDDDEEDEDEILSNPRRPSPSSQAYSSSNASSIRSLDIEIEINKKSEKNLCIRTNKKDIPDKVNLFFYIQLF